MNFVLLRVRKVNDYSKVTKYTVTSLWKCVASERKKWTRVSILVIVIKFSIGVLGLWKA